MSWKRVSTSRTEDMLIANKSCGWPLGLEAEFYV